MDKDYKIQLHKFNFWIPSAYYKMLARVYEYLPGTHHKMLGRVHPRKEPEQEQEQQHVHPFCSEKSNGDAKPLSRHVHSLRVNIDVN